MEQPKITNLFVYVPWPLSQQWIELSKEDEFKDIFGSHLCSSPDEDNGVYVNKNFYDSFE